MLLRSGDNLLTGVKKFIKESEEVFIYVPFIITSKLEEILGDTPCRKLIVRWQANDILSGACEFEPLYQFCSERQIILYRNTRLHLKVVQNTRGQLFYGSANISNRGMGHNDFNWELSGITEEISIQDRVYLDKIISHSDYVDQEYFNDLKIEIDRKRDNYTAATEVEEVEILDKKSKFLLSVLPMSSSPEKLWEIYSGQSNYSSELEVSCAAHDLANYNIPTGLKSEDFNSALRDNFNNHAFIQALKKAISRKYNRFMGYTEIIIWLQENTTTVPTPRRWEIRDARKVQILHRWIKKFDANFGSEINYPKGSDKLYYVGEFENDFYSMEELISRMRIDRARGRRAPHQLVLLIALSKLIRSKNTDVFSIEDILMNFEDTWKKNKHNFYSKNPNIGMPLRALIRLGYIEIDQTGAIVDFRNTQSLLDDIKLVKVKDPVKRLLSQVETDQEILKYLK